jgi:hypothetical protein
MAHLSEKKAPESISIRPSIAEKAKLAAARKDIPFSAWVERAIRTQLLLEMDTPEFWDGDLPCEDHPGVPCTGCVYVLKVGDRYKIGRTENLTSRLRSIQTSNPKAIEVVHTIESEDFAAIEKAIHRKFKDQRVRGEWFKLDRDDLAWITSTDNFTEN